MLDGTLNTQPGQDFGVSYIAADTLGDFELRLDFRRDRIGSDSGAELDLPLRCRQVKSDEFGCRDILSSGVESTWLGLKRIATPIWHGGPFGLWQMWINGGPRLC